MSKLEWKTAKPWKLKTAPGTAEYTVYVEDRDGLTVPRAG